MTYTDYLSGDVKTETAGCRTIDGGQWRVDTGRRGGYRDGRLVKTKNYGSPLKLLQLS